MPPEHELNAKFSELVDELDLDRPHREAMFSMSSEKKWQIYCSKKRDQDEGVTQWPDYYIDHINKMNSRVSIEYDNSVNEAKQSLVDSLKTALRTQPMRYAGSIH